MTMADTYAIIESGGKQYRAEKGSTLVVDRLRADEGDKVTLRAVMFRNDGDTVLDAEKLEKVKVEAVVAGHERGPKIRVFKYRAKKGYRKRAGHRSELTRLEVSEVKLLTRKPAAKKPAAKKPRGQEARRREAGGQEAGRPRSPRPRRLPPRRRRARQMAHKKGLGSSRNGRDSNPKMLGVKIFAGQRVDGGEIIVRQRGTRFRAGAGAGIGRDHTIFAARAGTVEFASSHRGRTVSVVEGS